MWATMRLLMVALLAGAPLVAGKAKLVHNGDDTDLVTHELPGLLVGWRSAGPLRTHVTVVGCPVRREAVVIDSSGGADSVVRWAAAKGLTVSRLLQTHEHFDHTLGLEAMQNATHAPIYLHPDGLAGYNQLPSHASKYGVHAHDPPAPAHWLKDGEVIEVGQLRLEVMATPGHAPGHVCFYERSHDILFGGDLIIGGTVGRTDLPGADTDAMSASLQRVLRLPHKTVLYSGHSPPTTLQQELKSNTMVKREWRKMLPLKEKEEL